MRKSDMIITGNDDIFIIIRRGDGVKESILHRA